MQLDSNRDMAESRKLLTKAGLSSAANYLYSLEFKNKFEFFGKTLLRISVISSLIQLLAYAFLIPSFLSFEPIESEILMLVLFPFLHLFSVLTDLLAALGLSVDDSGIIKKSFISSLTLFVLFLGFLLLLLKNTMQKSDTTLDIKHPLRGEQDSIYPTINYSLIFFSFFTYQALRLAFIIKSFSRHNELLSKSNLENS